jgi:hypothetical protein
VLPGGGLHTRRVYPLALFRSACLTRGGRG